VRALLDVNVLIALLDADHVLHSRATQWFAEHARSGWASCPITQNGCLRIMSHPGYPGTLPVRAISERLSEAAASEFHEFWPDDFSVLDARMIDTVRIHGPRQITDVYLLALVVRRGGRFVTFDASVALDAVKGADGQHLLRL
jgi:toxin-antitoxin system PIN domain toxin